MKKITLLLIFVFMIVGLSAQEIQKTQLSDKGEKVKPNTFVKKIHSSKDTTSIGWIYPGWSIYDNLQGGVGATHYSNPLFPDSTVTYIGSTGTLNWNWTMSIGCTFDPTSLVLDTNWSTPPVEPGKPYIIDTIECLAWYNKVENYDDTLILEIVYGEPQVTPPFRNVYIPGSPDSTFYSPPSMQGSSAQFGYHAKLTWPNKIVLKHVLDDNDTTMNFGKYIQFPIPQANKLIQGNNIVGVSITFVPGYPYNFGDTIYDYGSQIAGKNVFRFGWYRADDGSPDNFFYDIDGWNCGYFIMTGGRYGIYTNQLVNEIMYPQPESFPDIGFSISTITGIEDEPAISNVDIYPNPTTGDLYIKLSSHEKSLVTVYNLLGDVVSESSLKSTTNTIDLSQLDRGMYIVQVLQGTKVYTKKVVLK